MDPICRVEADQEMIPKNESLKNNQFWVYWSKVCKPVLPSENVHFRIQKRCYKIWPKTGDKSFQANYYCRSFRKSVFFLSAFFDCAIRLQIQSKKSIRKRVTAVLYNNSADAGLAAVTAASSRRKSAWRFPSSAHQQRVSYDGSSAR